MASGNRLTSPKRGMLWHATINIMGTAAPLIISLASIPYLLKALGYERFGLLSLLWTLISYLTVLDFGTGRALTRELASEVGAKSPSNLVLAGACITTVLSIAAGVLIWTGSHLLAGMSKHINEAVSVELDVAFKVLACGVPFFALGVMIEGVLVSMRKFGALAFSRLLVGSSIYIAPLTVAYWGGGLPEIIGITVICRVLILAATSAYALSALPKSKISLGGIREDIQSLSEFGSWVTVSGVISPIMASFDRFFIAARLPAYLLPLYTIPFSLVTRLSIIPNGFTAVLFPEMASIASSSPTESQLLYARSVSYLTLFGLLTASGIVMLGGDLMSLWIGEKFATDSSQVVRFIAVGFFASCVAQAPYTFLHSINRPDITAKLHMVELPLYLAVLWFFLGRFGIAGAAAAWALRSIGDAIALHVITRRMHGIKASITLPWVVAATMLGAMSFLIPFLPNLAIRLLGCTAISSAIILSFVLLNLKGEERSVLIHKFAGLIGRESSKAGR